MKKNKKIYLSILPFLFLVNTFPVFAQKPAVKKVEKKQVFDFRKTNWEANLLQVQATEKDNPVKSSEDFLAYKDNMFDNDVTVEYYFENNKLIKAGFVFDGTFTNQEDYIAYYKKIKMAVSSKYGHPKLDNSKELDVMEESQHKHMAELLFRGVNEYETIWELPKTRIIFSLKGKNMFSKVQMGLMYYSKKLRKLDKEEEVDMMKF